MSSLSLLRWHEARVPELEEIEHAHRSVGGSGRGRRYATQQINHAYAMLLSSQFQGYCRDLHTECVSSLVAVIQPASSRPIFRSDLAQNRKLDFGNPNPGNLGADFGRLGVALWRQAKALDVRNVRRQVLLEELNSWRNAIAHHDFDPARLGGVTVLPLSRVRQYRQACTGLAQSFDQIMHNHLMGIIGTNPW